MATPIRRPSLRLLPWLSLAVAGCGFSATAATTGSDAPTGGSDGSSQPTSDAAPANCFDRWRAPGLMLHPPVALANQTPGDATVRDPWISGDGLRLYYTYLKNGAGNHTGIYLATRTPTSPTTAFPAGVAVTELNDSDLDNQSRPSLSDDENTVVFSSDRLAANVFSVFLATRDPITHLFDLPTPLYLTQVNLIGNNRYDPFWADGGKALYFAPGPVAPSNLQQAEVATRADLLSDFGVPTLLSVDNMQSSADPAVSSDGSVLVFSSFRDGNGNASTMSSLFYALRANPTDPAQTWGPPNLIPNVNVLAQQGDPVLTADGCTLYFSAHNGNGNATFGLYTATVDTDTK